MSKIHRKKKGLLLAADDLEVGKHIAVHSVKWTKDPMPFFGVASEVKAINLPFVIVQPVGSTETATLDVRYLNLMPVTDEFVRAQQSKLDK